MPKGAMEFECVESIICWLSMAFEGLRAHSTGEVSIIVMHDSTNANVKTKVILLCRL